MTRTHICLQQVAGAQQAKQVMLRIEEPDDVTSCDDLFDLDISNSNAALEYVRVPGAPAPTSATPVSEAGAEILRRLSAHPGVREALERAATAQTGSTHPIHIETAAPDAEALPWEILFHKHRGFLALDDRWPISRLVGRKAGRVSVNRLVKSTVKLCAVLAAKDRDARPEWAALHTALRQSGIAYEVLTLVAQRDLHTEILTAGDDAVLVEYVPGGPTAKEDLLERIEDFGPNLLHFFCHGSATFGGYVEVASRNTIDLGEEPIYLNASALASVTTDALLMTLSACEGALASTDAHSLAYALVKDGLPAAVGMRHPIESSAAHDFCGAFYAKALDRLSALGPAAEVEIDWAPAMPAPRRQLCARYPGPVEAVAAAHTEWTLPVLYRRPEPLRVAMAAPQVGEDPQYLFGMLETLRTQRANMHPSTPPDKVKKLDRLVHELELMLKAKEG